MSIREISRMLERSPSTISREIKRGVTIDGTYFSESTERELRRRLKNKQSPAIIQRDIERDVGLKIGKDAIYEYIYRFKYLETISNFNEIRKSMLD